MAENLFGKMKNFLFDGLKEGDENYTEDYYDDFDEPSAAPVKSTGKVVNIHPGANIQMRVSIFEPVAYEECPAIADALKSKKIVMVNLENVKEIRENDKIRCFLNGVVYAMDGTASNISQHILVLAPPNVEIDGNIKKELENKGIFRW